MREKVQLYLRIAELAAISSRLEYPSLLVKARDVKKRFDDEDWAELVPKLINARIPLLKFALATGIVKPYWTIIADAIAKKVEALTT